jgi:hypothetical protein
MDAADALPILRALADGRDPVSGAPLGSESVFQRPEVIRALFAAVLALDAAPRVGASEPSAPTGKKPPSSGEGSAWTAEEEARMVAAFEAGTKPAVIAEAHGRTRGAINSRLKKLGLIEGGDAAPAPSIPAPALVRPVNRKPADDIPF